MRLWRTLKSTGCGVLRDGVYILPTGAPQASALIEVEAEVRSAGGFAIMAELTFKSGRELQQVQKLFQRNDEYGAFVSQVKSIKPTLGHLGQRKGDTALQRLRRAYEELVAIDFYPGEAQLQARETLAALEREAQLQFAGGEPRRSRARVRRLNPEMFRGRTWATRKQPGIDRLASAWLIRRFIDPKARFAWIERARDCPAKAIGFDFDGARFTHSGNRVTYEILVASFGLAQDPALASLGAAVHYLDIGGIPVPDSKGLETLLGAVRHTARSDDQAVIDGAKIFDLFYAAYAQRSKHADSQELTP